LQQSIACAVLVHDAADEIKTINLINKKKINKLVLSNKLTKHSEGLAISGPRPDVALT
jgi:hypothetical protein